MDTKLEKAAEKLDSIKAARVAVKREANEVEASYAASTHRHHARQREENRLEWIDYFTRQYRAHARLAASYAAKAVALQDGEEGSYGS